MIHAPLVEKRHPDPIGALRSDHGRHADTCSPLEEDLTDPGDLCGSSIRAVGSDTDGDASSRNQRGELRQLVRRETIRDLEPDRDPSSRPELPNQAIQPIRRLGGSNIDSIHVQTDDSVEESPESSFVGIPLGREVLRSHRQCAYGFGNPWPAEVPDPVGERRVVED